MFNDNKPSPIPGLHFMTLTESQHINELHDIRPDSNGSLVPVIVFSSTNTFEALRDTKKKDITSYSASEDKLYMDTTNGKIQIGAVVPLHSVLSKVPDEYNDMINFKKNIQSYPFSATLKSEMVDDLQTKCITIDWDGFRIRMSKRLIPNLKKDDHIQIHYKNIGEDYFNAIFEVTKKSGIKIFHSYDFINY
jgi:hypothetical protein